MPEIRVGNLLPRQGFGVALDDDASLQHAHDPVRDFQRALQILFDKQNRRSRRNERFDRFVDKIDGQRRQS